MSYRNPPTAATRYSFEEHGFGVRYSFVYRTGDKAINEFKSHSNQLVWFYINNVVALLEILSYFVMFLICTAAFLRSNIEKMMNQKLMILYFALLSLSSNSALSAYVYDSVFGTNVNYLPSSGQ